VSKRLRSKGTWRRTRLLLSISQGPIARAELGGRDLKTAQSQLLAELILSRCSRKAISRPREKRSLRSEREDVPNIARLKKKGFKLRVGMKKPSGHALHIGGRGDIKRLIHVFEEVLRLELAGTVGPPSGRTGQGLTMSHSVNRKTRRRLMERVEGRG